MRGHWAVSHLLFTNHHKPLETTSPKLGSRIFAHAPRKRDGAMFVLIRLIVIVVRALAGNAFAGWQFSESTYPTLIYQIPRAQNYFGATSGY
jgi:hypothetical protein